MHEWRWTDCLIGNSGVTVIYLGVWFGKSQLAPEKFRPMVAAFGPPSCDPSGRGDGLIDMLEGRKLDVDTWILGWISPHLERWHLLSSVTMVSAAIRSWILLVTLSKVYIPRRKTVLSSAAIFAALLASLWSSKYTPKYISLLLSKKPDFVCEQHHYTTEIISTSPLLIYIKNFITTSEASALITLGYLPPSITSSPTSVQPHVD